MSGKWRDRRAFTDQDREDAEQIEKRLREVQAQHEEACAKNREQNAENHKLRVMLANRDDQLRRVAQELRRCQRALDGFYRAGQTNDDQIFATVRDFDLETDFNAIIRGGYLSDGDQ